MGVMEHTITKGEEEAYQSEIQYRNAQNEFRKFIKMQKHGANLNLYPPFWA